MGKKIFSAVLFLCMICLLGCGITGSNHQTPTSPGEINEPEITKPACGSFTPQVKANPNAFETVVESLSIKAPSGNTIYALIRRPAAEGSPDTCFPAVVLVPGGINPGRMLAFSKDAETLAGSGMVVVTFNAEGRVDDSPDDLLSEGTEDFNGFRQQDGLCALVEYVMELPYVSADNVGIATQSYGITMGAGCAGRYLDIPIKYLVDGEGPADSFTTCHGPRFLAGDMSKYDTVKRLFGRLATWQDDSAENTAWWSEREAVRFIGDFNGYYLRLQAEWDHAQPPENPTQIEDFYHPEGWPSGGPAWWQNKHAADMVNAAVAGGVPWVRVNLEAQGNPINATYSFDEKPFYLPGYLAEQPWSVRAILEMVNLPPISSD